MWVVYAESDDHIDGAYTSKEAADFAAKPTIANGYSDVVLGPYALRVDKASCMAVGCRGDVHEPPCPLSDPKELSLYARTERRLVAHLRGLLREAIEHLDAMPEKHRPGDSRMGKLRQGLRVATDPRLEADTDYPTSTKDGAK